jgi:hypothetical protein
MFAKAKEPLHSTPSYHRYVVEYLKAQGGGVRPRRQAKSAPHYHVWPPSVSARYSW